MTPAQEIAARPAEINERRRAGDWEVDLIIGAGQQGVLLVAVERQSRIVRCRALESKESAVVARALVALLRAEVVRSLTYDRGLEWTRHAATAAALGAESYFCRPYHSWEPERSGDSRRQKGSVENMNGLFVAIGPHDSGAREIPPRAMRGEGQELRVVAAQRQQDEGGHVQRDEAAERNSLLNRLVVIPFYPISQEMLRMIISLNLKKVQKRVKHNHGIPFTWDDTLPALIAERCSELERGARLVDATITNQLLPEVGKEFLDAALEGRTLEKVHVTGADATFPSPAPARPSRDGPSGRAGGSAAAREGALL